MKILLTGSNGLLGQKLVKRIVGDGNHRLIATSRGENRLLEIPTDKYTYVSLDITNKAQVERVFTDCNPDVVIHTAAMTNVDHCEENQSECWELNVGSVQHLLEACQAYDTKLVHVSTDFIFDGSDGPLTEEARPNPVNYYGKSKLAAEELVMKSDVSWSIARTVLVYGIAQDMSRSNIILWVKNSLENKKEIFVVNDQWRTPTLAEDLAEGCFLIATKRAEGVYNISGKDFLSPYQMAIQTANYFGLDKNLIHETDGSRFTQKAKRPPKTGFVIDKAREILGYEPHSFVEGLAILEDQLKN